MNYHDDDYFDLEYDRDPYGDNIEPPDDYDDDYDDVPMQSMYPDDENDLIDDVGFADPGGHSALRAATPRNPRNLPCPNCKQPNRLTTPTRSR